MKKSMSKVIGGFCALQGLVVSRAYSDSSTVTLGSLGDNASKSANGLLSAAVNLFTLIGFVVMGIGIYMLIKGRQDGGDKGKAIMFTVVGAILPVIKTIQLIWLGTLGVDPKELNDGYEGIEAQ